jgi:hypothetical protein
LLGRALVIHTADHPDGEPDAHLGHGCIVSEIGDILLCPEKAVTIVFQGDILPTRIVKLPLPLPAGLQIPGKIQITWTVAALPPVDQTSTSDYTSCCLEDTFYPNSKRYSLSPKSGTTGKPKQLNIVSDKNEIKALLANGWKRSAFPVTESGNQYQHEETRRKVDCQWEPLVRRVVSKQARSFDDPFLTLHAIGRNGVVSRFDYVVVATITAKSFDGDLYTEIRRRYPALAPIRVRTEAEVRIQI